jgi:GT2 family glycosyltransferase
MNPFFSVIIPTYNRADLVRQTLESVLAQRFDDYEIIVVDDCSQDDTVAIARAVSPRVNVIVQPSNQGPGAARNVALQHARGKYVTPLDSDDVWFPWTLQAYRKAIEQFDDPAFVAAQGTGFRTNAKLATVREEAFAATAFADYLAYEASGRLGYLVPTGVAIRTDVARGVGGFCERVAYFEDNDMWLRLGTAPRFVRITAPCCWALRQHPQNRSKDFSTILRGMDHFLREEEQGRYPGGDDRRIDRLRVITAEARHVVRKALESNAVGSAWHVYRRTLAWNLECGRWRFLLGFPIASTARPLFNAMNQRRRRRRAAAA